MHATPMPINQSVSKRASTAPLSLDNCFVDDPAYWVVLNERSPVPVILKQKPTAASGVIIGSCHRISTANQIILLWISADKKKKKDRRDHALYTFALALLLVAASLVPLPQPDGSRSTNQQMEPSE